MNKILGYNKLVFRGDQEPALRTMMDRIKMMSGEQCTLEYTPVGESQSNGAVESAVKEIRGMYKTMRSDVETDYGKTIPGNHPIQPWLVRHASSTRFRESVGQDGRTAYSRIKGRNFNKEIVKIGECVWYMKPKSKHKKKGDYGWGDGIWLGVRDESGEYLIGTNKGECEYAIRRGAQDMNRILGYNTLVFRGDQEPALRVMMSRIKMLSGEQCTLEETPVGESQSNGAVESAVKELPGMYKTMRSDMETNYGKTIPGSHPIHTWARHGKTAYSRIKGRSFNKEMVKIGECVWYMKPTRERETTDGEMGYGLE